jgi:putative oxidoreductase
MSVWHAWGTTILRVSLGAVYVMHGWLAAFELGPDAVGGYVTRIGYPVSLASALAWYLIVVHLVGGALLVGGLFTRPAALAQLPIMASAVFLLHWPQGFFMRGLSVDTPAGPRLIAGGVEYALLVLAATLALTLLGPGAASIDHARGKGPRIEMP